MARYDRNRGMYFGSWTGTDIAADFKFTVGDSTGITKAELDTDGAADFATQAVNSGEFQFMYDGDNWILNGVKQTIANWGIKITGEPAKGDIIVVDYTKASGGWEALGKDNDDLSKELNPDTESSKNVLGETTFRHMGYEPSVSVDPYYIDPSRKLYDRIRQNAIEEKYGENDLKGYFAEAFFTWANKETRKMGGYCFVREAWFVPQSTGGDTTAYGIPIEIHPVGPAVKKNIVYDMDTNEASIEDIPVQNAGN